eukprot:GHVU01110814.1.p4 GENE.GHVU01110814.1~~GHVU01110814.1.p4  ORF type:complete len:114 (-),score=4.74 GHVU01110814.1:812-1153(-)
MTVRDMAGRPLIIVLAMNVGGEGLPLLTKTLYLHLVAPPELSWVIYRDYYGIERKCRCEDPSGIGSGGIPLELPLSRPRLHDRPPDRMLLRAVSVSIPPSTNDCACGLTCSHS